MTYRYSMFALFAVLAAVQLGGCTMLYQDRTKVLIKDVDIDQTLQIAELELKENKMSSVLTVWAMRDQILTPEEAQKVSTLYFKYINRIDSKEQKSRMFSVWHFTWAISDMYRLGNSDVKAELKSAYADAAKRVDRLDSNIATKFFYGEKMEMGDAHFLGRAYAHAHIVAPGNDKYVQSVDAYKEEKELD